MQERHQAPYQAPVSKPAQQSRHLDSKTSGNHLQSDDADLAFALFDVRYVASVHVQVNSHVGLGPSFPLSQKPDALPNLNQKGMIRARHPFMVAVLFKACVWYARHRGKQELPKSRKAADQRAEESFDNRDSVRASVISSWAKPTL